MKKNKRVDAYPYLQVIVVFAGLGSVISGLIVQLCVLLVFREADFVQISYQSILYFGLLGFIPALLTGIIIASKKIWRGDHKSIRTSFLTGFVTSAFYMGAIAIYLGIHSWIEIGVLLAFMFFVGGFGVINSVIVSCIALPKVCKSRFDITPKKEDDGYKGLT